MSEEFVEDIIAANNPESVPTEDHKVEPVAEPIEDATKETVTEPKVETQQ